MSFEKHYVKVFYNIKFLGVEIKWEGYANDNEYKEALNEAFKIISAKKCTRWLSDMTNGKAVSNEANQWVKTIFIPKVIHQGVKKAAFIMAKDIFRKMSANSLKTVIDSHNVELQYFDNRIAAENWLKK